MLSLPFDWLQEDPDPLRQLALITGGVLILSFIVVLVFVRKGKPRAGLVAGLSIILLVWAISEIWVIGTCVLCRPDPLCCEWTAIGVVTFALMGTGAALAYLALAIGGVAVHGAVTKRLVSKLLVVRQIQTCRKSPNE